MPNPSNKQELLAAMADGYAKLNEQISKMSEEAISTPFDFTADPKKCGVRWQYDRCLRDLLIHLYEWQVLMREFVNNIREGHPRDYLPAQELPRDGQDAGGEAPKHAFGGSQTLTARDP